jgi:hypothetical protein
VTQLKLMCQESNRRLGASKRAQTETLQMSSQMGSNALVAALRDVNIDPVVETLAPALNNRGGIRPYDVFAPAIMHNAVAVIVAHNHPSGDGTPSPEDRDVTHRLKEAGKLFRDIGA